jgi:hypothetical protein
MKYFPPALVAFFAAFSAHAQVAYSPAGSSPDQPQPGTDNMAPVAAEPPPAATASSAVSPAPAPVAGAPEQALAPVPAQAVAPPAASVVPSAAPVAPVAVTPAEPSSRPRPAPAGPMKIELPDATIKFGFLLQPQYEVVGNATLSGASHNIFIRRTRILVGATLFKNFEFFFDTDFPNLFRAANNTAGEANTKATPGMNVQDAFATAKALGNALMIDLGYMLPPLGHNAVQGATSLYSWDYFCNSFRHSNVFASSADPVGRDAGVQLRGLVLNDILEYRVGMFQGKRGDVSATQVAGRNMFRVAGRLQINLLDAETSFFYAG